MKTAILIDADFFLRNLEITASERTPQDVVFALKSICRQHLELQSRSESQLYRIFVYDCPPITGKVFNPLTKLAIDLGASAVFHWRTRFHPELIRTRKVALRLGELKIRQEWVIKSNRLKDLIKGTVSLDELSDPDIRPNIVQKGVDMRIGIDIANLAFRRLVDQIVLITGDSDFIPAAKLARREGIDLILDPMGRNISDELRRHVDGIQSIQRQKSTE